MVGKTADDRTHNVVTTDDKGVVVVVLRGKQTGEDMIALAAELQKRVDALRAQGKKALILGDIRALKNSDVTSKTRQEGKKVLAVPIDAAALLGSPGLMGTIMYALRIARIDAKVRFFTRERKARGWLTGIERPKQPRAIVSLVAGAFAGLIGLSALIGSEIDNSYLTSGLPSLDPMRPIAAIGLLAIGYGFVCYYFGRMRWLKLAGMFGVALGITMLALPAGRAWFGSNSGAEAYTHSASSAAICFIAIGLSTLTAGTKKRMVRLLQYVFGATLIGLSLFNIYGQLYAYNFMYGPAGSFVMPFNLAIAFLAAGSALVLLVLYRRVGNVLGGVTRIGWLVVAALILVQVATYSTWSQAVVHNKANASEAFLARSEALDTGLDQHVQAYTDALHGFKGLFASSDYVDQGEFQSYYDSLNLSATYPGLRTLTFIAKVQESDLPAFVSKHRADTSLHPGGNPAFAITAKSNDTTHYIVTYSTSGTAGGADLGSNPSRLAAFRKADASDGPVSSGTVQFAAANGVPAQTGFFITIPVSDKKSGNTPVGFVNAVFNYQDFFAHAFSPPSLLNGLAVSIADPADNSVVYQLRKGDLAKDAVLTRILNVSVADHTWRLRLSAPAVFGINASQQILPRAILIGGQSFALLLLAIFVLQTRARRQGFKLADSLTEDLERERNQAVASDQKSSAILASIGDAVFAVDTNLRVTLFNPSAQRISGFSQAEVLGKRYDEVLKFEFEKTGHTNDHFIHEALAGRLTFMVKHTVLVKKDGKRIPVADSAAPIRDAAQKVQGAIVVFRDVSKDYELDKAKTEFVSLASHQLRTPLSAINWYGEMLLDGDAGKLTKSQHEYMQEIFEGNKRMIELVNSLLNVSRLELGKLASQPQPTSIEELINGLEKELAPSIHGKQLKFVKAMSNLPLVVADPKQLRMIVQNLLSNAVKYTPAKGLITVNLRKATAADLTAAKLKNTAAHWYFSVQDTGYGIPKDQQSKIFSKLFRADNARKLDVEGTGLGLYIVKEVAEKLGGRVWFESVESVGTTFHVVLPLHAGHRFQPPSS